MKSILFVFFTFTAFLSTANTSDLTTLPIEQSRIVGGELASEGDWPSSWTHNIERMTAKGRHTNYAYLHPVDMSELGIKDLDLIDIQSETSTIRIRVRALDTLMPKTVAVPHGWGHQHAKGLTHANKTEGVNVNLLAADGPEKLDKISGMAHLTGILVEITPSASELQPNWSGL